MSQGILRGCLFCFVFVFKGLWFSIELSLFSGYCPGEVSAQKIRVKKLCETLVDKNHLSPALLRSNIKWLLCLKKDMWCMQLCFFSCSLLFCAVLITIFILPYSRAQRSQMFCLLFFFTNYPWMYRRASQDRKRQWLSE